MSAIAIAISTTNQITNEARCTRVFFVLRYFSTALCDLCDCTYTHTHAAHAMEEEILWTAQPGWGND